MSRGPNCHIERVQGIKDDMPTGERDRKVRQTSNHQPTSTTSLRSKKNVTGVVSPNRSADCQLLALIFTKCLCISPPSVGHHPAPRTTYKQPARPTCVMEYLFFIKLFVILLFQTKLLFPRLQTPSTTFYASLWHWQLVPLLVFRYPGLGLPAGTPQTGPWKLINHFLNNTTQFTVLMMMAMGVCGWRAVKIANQMFRAANCSIYANHGRQQRRRNGNWGPRKIIYQKPPINRPLGSARTIPFSLVGRSVRPIEPTVLLIYLPGKGGPSSSTSSDPPNSKNNRIRY